MFGITYAFLILTFFAVCFNPPAHGSKIVSKGQGLHISKKLRISKDNVNHYKIVKRSIDARKKHDIYFVYRLLVEIKNESSILSKNIINVEVYREDKLSLNTNKHSKEWHFLCHILFLSRIT